jgi:hypothetical protein
LYAANENSDGKKEYPLATILSGLVKEIITTRIRGSTIKRDTSIIITEMNTFHPQEIWLKFLSAAISFTPFLFLDIY